MFSPIPENSGFAGVGFYMDQSGKIEKDIDGVIETETFAPIPTVPSSASEEADARGHRRFLMGFQGGEDGDSPVLPVLLGDDDAPRQGSHYNESKTMSPRPRNPIQGLHDNAYIQGMDAKTRHPIQCIQDKESKARNTRQ